MSVESTLQSLLSLAGGSAIWGTHDYAKNLSKRSEMNSKTKGRRMGLVAGWGKFPVEIAQRCKQEGIELHVVGLVGHADPLLAELGDRFQWMGVAKLGGHIRFFRNAGVRDVAFAGKLFKHQLLYQKWGWLRLLPDWTCVRTLASIF